MVEKMLSRVRRDRVGSGTWLGVIGRDGASRRGMEKRHCWASQQWHPAIAVRTLGPRFESLIGRLDGLEFFPD